MLDYFFDKTSFEGTYENSDHVDLRMSFQNPYIIAQHWVSHQI